MGQTGPQKNQLKPTSLGFELERKSDEAQTKKSTGSFEPVLFEQSIISSDVVTRTRLELVLPP